MKSRVRGKNYTTAVVQLDVVATASRRHTEMEGVGPSSSSSSPTAIAVDDSEKEKELEKGMKGMKRKGGFMFRVARSFLGKSKSKSKLKLKSKSKRSSTASERYVLDDGSEEEGEEGEEEEEEEGERYEEEEDEEEVEWEGEGEEDEEHGETFSFNNNANTNREFSNNFNANVSCYNKIPDTPPQLPPFIITPISSSQQTQTQTQTRIQEHTATLPKHTRHDTLTQPHENTNYELDPNDLSPPSSPPPSHSSLSSLGSRGRQRYTQRQRQRLRNTIVYSGREEGYMNATETQSKLSRPIQLRPELEADSAPAPQLAPTSSTSTSKTQIWEQWDEQNDNVPRLESLPTWVGVVYGLDPSPPPPPTTPDSAGTGTTTTRDRRSWMPPPPPPPNQSRIMMLPLRKQSRNKIIGHASGRSVRFSGSWTAGDDRTLYVRSPSGMIGKVEEVDDEGDWVDEDGDTEIGTQGDDKDDDDDDDDDDDEGGWTDVESDSE
jgi:hypothetical protein